MNKDIKKNKKNSGNKIPIRFKFLIVMIVIYSITFVFSKSFVINSFNNFLSLTLKILPILLAVYVIMFVTNIFINDKLIKKHVGKESGMMGWVWVIIVGILVPSPPYIIFPFLSDMKKKGMKISLIVTFLYSRNLQIAFLPVMIYYFGLKFAVVISFFVFVFSILSGLLMDKLIVNENATN